MPISCPASYQELIAYQFQKGTLDKVEDILFISLLFLIA